MSTRDGEGGDGTGDANTNAGDGEGAGTEDANTNASVGDARADANESASVARHRAEGARVIGCAVLTVSDTRSRETDTGGALLAQLLADAGHTVVRRGWVADSRAAIEAAARELLALEAVDALLLTGGTGVAPRDVTPEALAGMWRCRLPGFGELFRALSFQEIGAAAMLSRAEAGFVGAKFVALLPGSRGAIRTALTKLLLPELGHLVAQARRAPAASCQAPN